MADFEYSLHDGMYSIFPNSDFARETVNAMIRERGSNKLFKFEFEAFKGQARRAGYTVRKFKPVIISGEHLAALLSA